MTEPTGAVANEPWHPAEVDAAIATYFALLSAQFRGERPNKAAAVRELASILRVRTTGSIERKLQNISAVLDELGLDWIDGYKPMSHYQHSLRDSVERALAGDHRIGETMAAYGENALPAPTSRVVSTGDVLVEPPSVTKRARPNEIAITTGPIGALRDFHNRRLGKAGEEWVVRIEREELRRAGRRDLAERVEWTSQERGDGAGFDVASYRPDGSPLLIEVKTTNLGRRTPFFVTRWELAVSSRRADEFALYRVFDFRSDPRLYRLDGSIEASSRLEPTVFAGLPR